MTVSARKGSMEEDESNKKKSSTGQVNNPFVNQNKSTWELETSPMDSSNSSSSAY